MTFEDLHSNISDVLPKYGLLSKDVLLSKALTMAKSVLPHEDDFHGLSLQLLKDSLNE